MPDWLSELSPEEREQWDDFVTHFRQEAVEMITKSAATISVVPNDVGDVKFWAELGASIMMDKPIIAVMLPGRMDIPEKLRRVVDRIIEVDIDTGEGQRQLAEALKDLLPAKE